MQIYKLKLWATVLLMLTLGQMSAQNSNHPWSVGLGVGLLEYNGDLGNGFFKYKISSSTVKGQSLNNQPGIAVITAARYLNEKFDVAMNGHWGEWSYLNTTNDANFSRNSRYLDVNLRWKFLGKDNARFIPFALIGLGFRNLDKNIANAAQSELVIPIGVGATLRCTDRIALNLQTNFGYTTGDAGDSYSKGGPDYLWNHTIGLAYLFGKPVPKHGDSDADGVKDNKDACPGTVAGALVDKTGCIIDADKDGVADNLDKCPAVAGIAKFNGCPDTDNDGIQDSEDKCPTVAGIAAFNGCPDSDNDGIQDNEDKCPKVAGLSKFQGCPDTDGDGIQDSEDKCPDVAGIAANNGCPEVKPVEVKPVTPEPTPVVVEPVKKDKQKTEYVVEEIQHITFEVNSYKITKESTDRLLLAIEVLKKNPDYHLIVSGYTDNTGTVMYNLVLSRERAEAVKNYLVSKGIKANRIATEGFGIESPIADNNTEAGRLENRRAVLKTKIKIVK